MACSRCGARRPQRPVQQPSSMRPAGGIVPNPAPTVPSSKGHADSARNAIMGLTYVPGR